ncbi:hypothetical protein BCR35DRAFT_303449 [Leucosporidium creatinivorum]|uniref:F-box domain-containing protein n=1 Tax=Leucosporidium creatinivorum TaxID=106004 RepID=A0A1Y2FHZ7_9BASI|nr:hypothetical protein BCR35DRAFT_303449 [Leucosporidium creatinivorum]
MPCPSLPTELVTQIICEAAIELPTGETFQRNKDLRSFSLVSSQWRAIAQAELIRQPTVGTLRCIRKLKDLIQNERLLRKKMKHLRFFPHGNDEAPLEEALSELLWAGNVDLDSVSICYRKVYQRKCLLLLMYCDTCLNLTSLSISHAEIQVPAEDDWRVVHFPHLHTLDLRRIIIATEDDDHYMWKLNDRASEILLPLGRKRLTPSLRTLRISASDIGSLNIGDFVELADQITHLSLGVFWDDAFLDPKLLDKFTALETLEVDWPLQKDFPFYKVKDSGSPLKTLRIRDRHDRPPTQSEWAELDDEKFMHLEWTPEPEALRKGSSHGAGTTADQDDKEEEDEDEEDEDEDEAEEDYLRLERLESIADSLCFSLRDFSELHTLVLPLKFGPALADIDADANSDCYDVPRLVTLCEELGIEIKIEERHWETDLAYKQFAKA